MADVNYLVRGSDETLRHVLQDENGDPVDIDSLEGITIEIFQKGNVFQKFSLNALAGYTPITVVDAAEGIIETNIEGENTVDGILNQPVFYSMKITQTDTDFDGDIKQQDTGNVLFAYLVDSVQKSVTTFE